MSYNNRKNLYEILKLNPNNPSDWQVLKSDYVAVDIDKIKIDGNTFTNYGQYSFLWEKTYVKSPVRSSSGSIGNLNSYATFVVPHLIIDFSIMTIDDYRAIMRLHYSKNEFVVECYDVIYNKKIKVKMYFATEQMAKLHTISRVRFDGERWEDFIELVGVKEYSVELIGTNNDLDLVSVTYHLNPPADTGVADETSAEPDVYMGEEILIGSSTDIPQHTFDGKYRFANWNLSANPVDKSKNVISNNSAYTVNTDLVLYAQWQPTTEHTLTFNYGIADKENAYEQSRTVVKGNSIGLLPIVETPTVKVGETTYTPYYNGAWYKTPTKASNSVPVTDNDLYWSDRSATIYLIYDIMTYSISYYVDGELNSSESAVEYNAILPLPQLVKSGYIFDGWYTDNNYSNKISGRMPPYSLSIYARWIKK